MSIVDRLVRRLCARPLEALAHEALTAQVAASTQTRTKPRPDEEAHTDAR